MPSLQELQGMDPYDFEGLVGEVWESKGYDTHVRQGSQDRGIDVEAEKDSERVLIQAKRYNSDNRVGSEEVRKYATLWQQEPSANKIIIVTTSTFTSEAKRVAAEQNITLVDGEGFLETMGEERVGNKKGESESFEFSPEAVGLTASIYRLIGSGVSVLFKIYVVIMILLGIGVATQYDSILGGVVGGTFLILLTVVGGWVVNRIIQYLLGKISSYLDEEAEQRRTEAETE